MSPSAETKGETAHRQCQRYDLLDFAVRTMSPFGQCRPSDLSPNSRFQLESKSGDLNKAWSP
jgi:hypothetical protein